MATADLPAPPRAAHRRAQPRERRADEVLIGVRNRAGRDFDMEVFDNDVVGGRGRTRIGVGNRAVRDNRDRVFRNYVEKTSDDEHEVAIGVANSAGRDSEMDVFDNEIDGGGGPVKIGVGNKAGRDNRSSISGNRILR